MPTRVLMPPAEHARVAEEADVRRHPVTLAEAAHAGTERLDHAMELVAHRERSLAARERVRPPGRDHQRTVAVLLEIGAADAAEADAEQDLAAPRGWNRDVLDPHVAPTVPAGRFHGELRVVVRATGIRPALTVTRPCSGDIAHARGARLSRGRVGPGRTPGHPTTGLVSHGEGVIMDDRRDELSRRRVPSMR